MYSYCLFDFQNENIGRPATSERMYADLHRPDRQTPKPVLANKTFDNVHTVWLLYIARNKTDKRYIDCNLDDGDAPESSNEIDDYNDSSVYVYSSEVESVFTSIPWHVGM